MPSRRLSGTGTIPTAARSSPASAAPVTPSHAGPRAPGEGRDIGAAGYNQLGSGQGPGRRAPSRRIPRRARAGRAGRPLDPTEGAAAEVLLRRARVAPVRGHHFAAGVLPDAC